MAISVLVALITFIIQSRTQIKIQRAEYIFRIVDKYDEICRIRVDNPDLIKTASTWESKKNYEDFNKAEREYYHYGEMVIGFIEISSYMKNIDKTLSEKAFNDFVLPIIKLEVKYNNRLLSAFVSEKDNSISDYAQKLIEDLLDKSL